MGEALINVVNRNFGSPLHYGVIFGSPSEALEVLQTGPWGLHNGSSMCPGVRYTAVPLTGELPGGAGDSGFREGERKEGAA